MDRAYLDKASKVATVDKAFLDKALKVTADKVFLDKVYPARVIIHDLVDSQIKAFQVRDKDSHRVKDFQAKGTVDKATKVDLAAKAVMNEHLESAIKAFQAAMANKISPAKNNPDSRAKIQEIDRLVLAVAKAIWVGQALAESTKAMEVSAKDFPASDPKD